MQYIYKISFPKRLSKKVYIGKTKNPRRRWDRHKREANSYSNLTIHRAMRKYGIKNTKFQIISTCLGESDQNAYTVEKELIKQYDSFHNGYNETEGGKGAGSGSSNHNFGKSPSEETRLKMRNSNIENENWKIGLEKLKKYVGDRHGSLGLIGEKSPNSKKWRIYFKNGEIIEIIGLQNWCKQNNYHTGHLIELCKGKRKSHKDIIKVEKLS